MEQPPSDFDGAWKYALEQYFSPFMALFFPEAHAAIDWRQPVVFRDTELQQIAPEDQEGKERVDKLVRVRRHDGTPALVYVHVEVQSQHDSAFAERMFRYHARLYDRDRVPVVSLAVLGDDGPNWRPSSFGYTIWGCELALRFPTVKVLALDREVLATTANPFATLVLLHRDAQETRNNPMERLRRKVGRYRTLLRQGYSVTDVRILLRLMDHLLRLRPDLTQLAYTALRQVEQEELGMETFVTSYEEIGREIGIKIGRAEGRAEGLVEGQRDLMLRLLDHKIGPLTPELQAQITDLSLAQLLSLSDAFLSFTSHADLSTWLEQQ